MEPGSFYRQLQEVHLIPRRQGRRWCSPSLIFDGYPELFLRRLNGRGVNLTTRLNLVPRLRMNGAAPPRFMSSGRSQGRLYLALQASLDPSCTDRFTQVMTDSFVVPTGRPSTVTSAVCTTARSRPSVKTISVPPVDRLHVSCR